MSAHSKSLISDTDSRVYGQSCIETLHERHNGIKHLVVCLSEYLPLRNVNEEGLCRLGSRTPPPPPSDRVRAARCAFSH